MPEIFLKKFSRAVEKHPSEIPNTMKGIFLEFENSQKNIYSDR